MEFGDIHVMARGTGTFAMRTLAPVLALVKVPCLRAESSSAACTCNAFATSHTPMSPPHTPSSSAISTTIDPASSESTRIFDTSPSTAAATSRATAFLKSSSSSGRMSLRSISSTNSRRTSSASSSSSCGNWASVWRAMCGWCSCGCTTCSCAYSCTSTSCSSKRSRFSSVRVANCRCMCWCCACISYTRSARTHSLCTHSSTSLSSSSREAGGSSGRRGSRFASISAS
mmetsp:Transcript_33509/g.49011  ORF Transcript_33509/g.49011 Transcript_33509/m.49011 type:complete len:229 (-) Transcript_33509:636-1322(-)